MGIKNNYALEIALIMLLSDEVGLTFETGITVDYGLESLEKLAFKIASNGVNVSGILYISLLLKHSIKMGNY